MRAFQVSAKNQKYLSRQAGIYSMDVYDVYTALVGGWESQINTGNQDSFGVYRNYSPDQQIN